MSLRDALSGLPDEAQVPVGWVREKLREERPEETPKGGDRRQRIIDIAVREGTKNIRTPGALTWAANGNGASRPGGRA